MFLTARVVSEGARFVATVDGIDLESSGNSRDAAQESLVQNMRGWLERVDTTGKLAEALGVDWLEEETEIVLRFVDGDNENGTDSG